MSQIRADSGCLLTVVPDATLLSAMSTSLTPNVSVMICSSLQISMNVTQTMEAVHRCVPIHMDHECVAAGLDTHWPVMAGHV